ncbi:MAG: bifunctional folylpolyglutamate synthase/dihydrofolate synthase [bacterium]
MYENETVQFLNRLRRFGWRLGLANITELLRALGNPHHSFPSVHIAGTNGKGSTAALLESILREAGYKTGLYTSPHLLDLTERIKINQEAIPWEVLHDYLRTIKRKIQLLECTYFETLTAIAFKYFADCKIDMAVVEVGLGGRLDATNVLQPELVIITGIDFDHKAYLGPSLNSIAREKGGIIKSGKPCLVCAENLEARTALVQIARERNAEFHDLKDLCTFTPIELTEEFTEFDLTFQDDSLPNLKLALIGRQQVSNAALAVAATRMLQARKYLINRSCVYSGLQKASLNGRLQVLQRHPKILLDVAHNPAAVRHLVSALKTIFAVERLLFIVGVLDDKDFEGMLAVIEPIANTIFCVTPSSDRALPAPQLLEGRGTHSGKYRSGHGIENATRKALQQCEVNDLLCVTGSHYTVGDFLKYYYRKLPVAQN